MSVSIATALPVYFAGTAMRTVAGLVALAAALPRKPLMVSAMRFEVVKSGLRRFK